MGTANTTVDMAIKPQTLDYAVVEVEKVTKNDDGTETKEIVFTAITGEKAIAKAEEAGKVKFRQTVGWNDPATDEGFKQVIKNEKERMKIVVAGLKSSRINPRVKGLLEEIDSETKALAFEPVQGVYDISSLIAEPAQRQRLTDMEKAVAAMAPLFPDKTEAELTQLIQFFRASGASIPGLSNDSEGEEEEVPEGEEATA